MSDRERLAADIAAWGEVSGREALADRLIAAGWTRLDEVAGVPVYCTGGCDECRDYARKKGVPFVHGDIVEYPELALDEERLARALETVIDGGWYYHDLYKSRPHEDAAAIAKAYREDAG